MLVAHRTVEPPLRRLVARGCEMHLAELLVRIVLAKARLARRDAGDCNGEGQCKGCSDHSCSSTSCSRCPLYRAVWAKCTRILPDETCLSNVAPAPAISAATRRKASALSRRFRQLSDHGKGWMLAVRVFMLRLPLGNLNSNVGNADSEPVEKASSIAVIRHFITAQVEGNPSVTSLPIVSF